MNVLRDFAIITYEEKLQILTYKILNSCLMINQVLFNEESSGLNLIWFQQIVIVTRWVKSVPEQPYYYWNLLVQWIQFFCLNKPFDFTANHNNYSDSDSNAFFDVYNKKYVASVCDHIIVVRYTSESLLQLLGRCLSVNLTT